MICHPARRCAGLCQVTPSKEEGGGAPKGAAFLWCRSVICGSPQIRGRGNAFRRSTAGLCASGPCFRARQASLPCASANQWRPLLVGADSTRSVPSPCSRGTAAGPHPAPPCERLAKRPSVDRMTRTIILIGKSSRDLLGRRSGLEDHSFAPAFAAILRGSRASRGSHLRMTQRLLSRHPEVAASSAALEGRRRDRDLRTFTSSQHSAPPPRGSAP